jgi:hypothetical protein
VVAELHEIEIQEMLNARLAEFEANRIRVPRSAIGWCVLAASRKQYLGLLGCSYGDGSHGLISVCFGLSIESCRSVLERHPIPGGVKLHWIGFVSEFDSRILSFRRDGGKFQ